MRSDQTQRRAPSTVVTSMMTWTNSTASIHSTGVLHPPAVTEEYVIIIRQPPGRRDGETRHSVTPVWVVPGVSDKLSYVLAIRDEQTLQKTLKPLEQAELYEELKALYAEDAERRDTAPSSGGGRAARARTRRRNEPVVPIRHHRIGRPNGWGKSRVQAAQAVTGRDSRTMLEQINQLKQIAADDVEDPVCASARRRSLVGDQRRSESQRPLPSREDSGKNLAPSHAASANIPTTPERFAPRLLPSFAPCTTLTSSYGSVEGMRPSHWPG